MDKELEILWQNVMKKLEKEMTSASYDTWIKPLVIYGLKNNELVLIAPDPTTRQMVEQRHLSKINEILTSYKNGDVKAKIILERDLHTSGMNIKQVKPDRSIYGTNLKSKYVFENFVKGKSNELAFAASVAVAESPGQTTYNPLFLYGGVGLGKTHLMHSIGNYILHRDPESKVLYTSSENLTNEFINSIKEKTNQQFRDKYRNVDVLLVDDIQFLSGKDGTQEEFFHTFNSLFFANKQIVISSDKPPIELRTLEERLTSRFGSGLIVDITLPDFETRTAILEKKAEMDNINVPSDVIRIIAKNVSSNIRELEGALTRVTAYAKLTNTHMTIDMAETALKDMVTENGRRDISVEYIQEVVSDHFKITIEEMRSKKRTANVAYARHVAMYLSHMLIDIPLIKIGQGFGGRDHTTVIHACNKMSEEYEVNPEFRDMINKFEKIIKSE